MSDKKDDKFEKNLVSDEEFADLMEASYEAEGKSVDVVSKRRNWKDVEKEIKGRSPAEFHKQESPDTEKEGDKFWQVGLALAACIFLSIGISVLRPMLSEPEQGIKGDEIPVPVTITGYVVDESGEQMVFEPNGISPPANILPVVSTTQPVFAALLSVSADGVPEVIVSEQQVAPGDEVEFSLGGEEVFVVDWSGETREVYCVVAFTDKADLAQELARLQDEDAFIFDGNCLVLPEVAP